MAYQALETTNAMHTLEDCILKKKPVIRRAKDDEKKKPAAKFAALFPKNVKGLVPSHLYGMMKKWYYLAAKENISEADKDSIKSIKWPKSRKKEGANKRDQGSGNPPHLAGSNSQGNWNARCGNICDQQQYQTPPENEWGYGQHDNRGYGYDSNYSYPLNYQQQHHWNQGSWGNQVTWGDQQNGRSNDAGGESNPEEPQCLTMFVLVHLFADLQSQLCITM